IIGIQCRNRILCIGRYGVEEIAGFKRGLDRHTATAVDINGLSHDHWKITGYCNYRRTRKNWIARGLFFFLLIPFAEQFPGRPRAAKNSGSEKPPDVVAPRAKKRLQWPLLPLVYDPYRLWWS